MQGIDMTRAEAASRIQVIAGLNHKKVRWIRFSDEDLLAMEMAVQALLHQCPNPDNVSNRFWKMMEAIQ